MDDPSPKSAPTLFAIIGCGLLLANLLGMLFLMQRVNTTAVDALAATQRACRARPSTVNLDAAQLRQALRDVRHEWVSSDKPVVPHLAAPPAAVPAPAAVAAAPRIKKTIGHSKAHGHKIAKAARRDFVETPSVIQPLFTAPQDHDMLWTELSLRTQEVSLLVHIDMPATLDPINRWQPVLDVTTNAGGKPLTLLGHYRHGAHRTIRLPVTALASNVPLGSPLDLGLALSGVTGEGQAHHANDPAQTLNLRLASLADLVVDGDVQLRLQPRDHSEAPPHGTWFKIPAETGDASSAPLVLQIYRMRDVAPLLPLLRNAASLTVAAGRSHTVEKAGGTCFVSKSLLRACAWGASLTDARIATLAGMFGADLAFRGPAGAYLGQPTTPSELAPMLDSRSGHLFIYEQRSGFRSYPVPATFVGRNAAAASYVADGTTAIFSEKVELLDLAKSAPAH